MEDQQNLIDNIFQKGLGDYAETPPPAAWDAMEKRLDSQVRKRFPYQWLLLALVSSAIVVGVLVSKKPANITGTTENANTDVAAAATHPAIAGTTNNAPVEAGITAARNAKGALTTEQTNDVAINNKDVQKEAATKTRNTIPVVNKIKNGVAGNKKANRRNNSVVVNNGSRKLKTSHPAGSTNAAIAVNDAPAVETNKERGNGTVAKTENSLNTANANNTGNSNTVAAVNVVRSATPSTANVIKNKNRKHDKPSNANVAPLKNVHASDDATATKNTTADAAKRANSKTEIITSKQNNIKVTSEVPADVLAASKQQQKESALAANKPVVAGAKNVQNTTPEKIAVNEVHPLKTQSAFTETVTVINIPVSASGTGSAGGGTADAAAGDKIKTTRWEAGLKAGYETGTKGLMADKYTFAPFLKYNISKRSSILIQPGIKFASIKNTTIDGAKNYYRINDSSMNSHTSGTFGGNSTVTYNYTESGDSFKVSHSIAQRNYMQFEVPVMFSYQASKNLSILAGISMIYSKLVSISKDSSSYETFNTHNSVTYTVPYGTPTQEPGLNAAIPHTALPYLTLANPAYQSVGGNMLSVGYMFGFSYSITKRFLFDALIQQSVAGFGNVKNMDIKSLYSQPYIRFTIGYKLIGNK